MTFNHLKYFIEVVNQKSFTKASEKLFISQSTISKALSSLEAELNTTLYEHGNREFILTQTGQYLYDFAKDVLGYWNVKEDELIEKIKMDNDKLKLGLPPTAGSIFFFGLIRQFKVKNPTTQLIINDATSKFIPDMLLEGKLDLGIVIEPFEDTRFIKKIAYQTESVLVVSSKHKLASQDTVSFKELKEELFLQVTKDFQYRQVFEKICLKAGFNPHISFESNQWDMILEMVADNQGITILPLPLVEKYKPQNVKCIHLTDPCFPWALTVIRAKGHPVTQGMKKFIELL